MLRLRCKTRSEKRSGNNRERSGGSVLIHIIYLIRTSDSSAHGKRSGNNRERVTLEERKELIKGREAMLPLHRLFRTIHTTLDAPQITTFALHAPKYVTLFPTYFPTDFNSAYLSPYIDPFLPFDFWVFVSDYDW